MNVSQNPLEKQLTYHIDSLGLLLNSYYPLRRAIFKAQYSFKQVLDLKSRSPFILKGRKEVCSFPSEKSFLLVDWMI